MKMPKEINHIAAIEATLVMLILGFILLIYTQYPKLFFYTMCFFLVIALIGLVIAVWNLLYWSFKD